MFQVPHRIPVSFRSSEGVYRDIHSPNTGEVFTSVQSATLKDLEFILSERQVAQFEMTQLRPYDRSAILKKVGVILKERSDEFAYFIALEGGKPLKDAKVEVTRAIATIELCAEETFRLDGEMIQMERTPAGRDHLAFTLKDPIGPVLAISAFNHPLNLIAHQVGCAIASGCSVVLKPASPTPLCADQLAKIFYQAGLSERCFRVINTEAQNLEELVTSTEFSFISFIGSSKVGWSLRSSAAPGTRLSLEHGGQAPAIIREDAKMDEAVTALVKGAFYHAGQVCISTQCIFVQKNIFTQFLEKFKQAALKLKVGPATDEETDVGPLIKPQEVVRIQNWIDEALKTGAKLELGNSVSGKEMQYLSPTIVTNVSRDVSLMKEEVFGPVVCINSYEDEDELLNYLNRKRYIFEAALFTQDLTHALKIAKSISTMTLVINNHSAFRVDQMPFGGHRESGLGMGGVKYAMEEMSMLKQVIIKI